MALFQMLNFVVMTLAEGLELDDTELTVLDSDLTEAAKYDPSKQLSLTLIGDEELNQYEIVYATARAGTTFTVLRGQEDTTRQAWHSGVRVIAALTSGMLQGITDIPTSADSIGYEGGKFGPSSTVEEAIDDLGDAVIRGVATTDYFEDVKERLGGGLLSNTAPNTTNLRWQASAGRIVTDGFGAVEVCEVAIAPLTIQPDVVVCMRSMTGDKLGTFKVVLYHTASGASMTWTVLETAFQPSNAWTLVWFSATSAVISGDPILNKPDKLKLEVNDDSTGAFTVDVNFVDLLDEHLSYIGSFVHILSDTDFDKVWAIEKFGYQVSLVVRIEDLEAETIDTVLLRKAEIDGNRIYLTSASDLKVQTVSQINAILFKGVRLCAAANLRPAGFVYPGLYNGPLTLDANTTIRNLVIQAYPRGVGVGSFRSAVDVYTFDAPLITAANLASAQSYLLTGDIRSINMDVSALTPAQLTDLYEDVFLTGSYYQARFPWQNAENITSGTLSASRLPIVPISKGGTGGGTLVQARSNLGISDPAGNVTVSGNMDIAGLLRAVGSIQGGNTVIAKAASAGVNAHFWLYGPAGQDLMVLYASGAGGHAILRVAGTQAYTFQNNGQFKAPGAVFAGGAYMNTDGNITGSVWTNLGYWDAYTAIVNRIESRGAAYQAGCVTSTRMAGVIDHSTFGGPGPLIEYSAYVITGYQRADTNRYLFRWRQPQVHYPAYGWVAAFGF